MHITDEMLKVAITKSVEAGLLPRRALKEDFYDAQIMMRMILQSTLDSCQATEIPLAQKKSCLMKTAHPEKKQKLIPVELHNFY